MDRAYHNATTLHPLAMVVLLALALWMIAAPRRCALVPVLVLNCFVSSAQRVVVMGLDFTLMKLMILVGIARMVLRNELRIPRLHAMDGLLVAMVLVNAIAYVSLHGTTQALINRLGWGFDVIGMYFVFRMLLRDWNDLMTLVNWLCWLTVPIALIFIIEQLTARNMFSVFGGVSWYTTLREGRLRCQGAFSHPILAGVFWVVLLPWFIACASRGRRFKSLAIIACISTTFIVVACASSTPAMGYLLVGGCFALYPFRGMMSTVRWGGVFALVFLHFYRSKPVWHLISRIDLSGGSTGWHRYVLIDGAIRGFEHWWINGASNLDFVAEGFFDITNQYLLEGFRGGFLALVLFVAVIVSAFRVVSRCVRRHDLTRSQRIFCWAMGTALTVHAVVFLAVSYFGQAVTVWYLQLAAIGSLAQMLDSPGAQTERELERAHAFGGSDQRVSLQPAR